MDTNGAFGTPDWHMIFHPDRVVIETRTGDLIAEQANPRETFAGHAWETPGRRFSSGTSTGTPCASHSWLYEGSSHNV